MLLFGVTALDDEIVALLVFATGLETLRKLAPWAHRVMTSATALGFTLTATHRVIDRVHYHTTDM